MVLQVVGLILNTLRLQVVFRVVSRTVDNVGDADLIQHLLISGDKVRPKPHEPIYNLRADSLVELIFIFFPRSALEIKVFIIQLIWIHFKLLELLRVTLALYL